MVFDRLFAPDVDKMEKNRDTFGLIKALSHKDDSVRSSAAKALGRLKSEPSVKPLINCLNDSSADVRISSIKALGELDSPDSVEPLIKCLADSSDIARGSAISVLAKNRNYQAIDSIIKCTNDESENVRKTAIKALRKFGTHAAVEPLIKLLDDENEDVCGKAEELLNEIIKTISPDSPKNLLNPEFLINCQKSKNEKVKFYASSVLAKMKYEAAADAFIRDLEDDNKDVRMSATTYLVNMGDKRATAPLVKGLQDDNEGARLVSITGLMKLKDPDALEILISNLYNCAPEEMGAISVLLQYDDFPGFIEYYVSNLSSCNDKVRSMSLTVFPVLFQKLYQSKKPGEEIHVAFDKYLGTNDHAAYFDTVKTLFNAFGLSALPEIIKHMDKHLTDSDPAVRIQAIETIELLGTDYRLARLLIDRLMYDSERDIRFKAAMALWNFKGIQNDGKMVEAFNSCFRNDPDERVRGALLAILNRPKDKYEKLYNEAVAFYQAGRYEEAIETFDKYLERRPSDEQAWNNKGACLMMLKRYAEAEYCFEKVLGININNRIAGENAFRCRLILGKKF